jgi:hypothetical protein
VQSKTTTLNQIERWIHRFKTETRESKLTLRVNHQLADVLRAGTISRLRRIMLKYFVWIHLEADPAVMIGEFRMVSKKQGKDITDLFK